MPYKFIFLFACLSVFTGCPADEDDDINESFDRLEIIISDSDDTFNELADLPSEIDEASGLIIVDSLQWFHNDSGGEPALFTVDPTNGLVRNVLITNAVNRDWEDIALSTNGEIFIGDIGNNFAARDELCFYEVSSFVLQSSNQTTAQRRFFNYGNQEDFTPRPFDNDFDAEAMIHFQDQLYIFTKNHRSRNTHVYPLDPELENQLTFPVDSFPTQGTITAAAINQGDDVKLALLGFNRNSSDDYDVFLWLFTGFTGHDFFSANQYHYHLPIRGQAEAIDFASPNELIIGTEAGDDELGKRYLLRLAN